MSAQYNAVYIHEGKVYLGNRGSIDNLAYPFTGGNGLQTQQQPPSRSLLDWLLDKTFNFAQTTAKKYYDTRKTEMGSLHHFAQWALNNVTGAKDVKNDEIFQSVVEAKRAIDSGIGQPAAAYKLATNLYNFPNETVQAIMDYGIADSNIIHEVEKLQAERSRLDWAIQGMQWIGKKIAKTALLSYPTMLGYYSLFRELPDTDKETVIEVKDVINQVQNRIIAKFRQRALDIDSNSALDLATRLVVLAYLHPTEMAHGILDYATENIVPDAIAIAQQSTAEPRMPGSWIGGGYRNYSQGRARHTGTKLLRYKRSG